jgi:hypothetical protein
MREKRTKRIIRTSLFTVLTGFLLGTGIYFFMSVYPSAMFFMIYIVALAGILSLHLYTEMQLRKLNEELEVYSEENAGLNNRIEELKQWFEEKNDISDKEDNHEDIMAGITKAFSHLPEFKDKHKFCDGVLSAMAEHFEIVTGLFFIYDKQTRSFSVEGNYGIMKDEDVEPFSPGEGLHGTAVEEGEIITLEDVPEEYFSGYSGLGEAKPAYIYILPVGLKEDPLGVIEIASFKKLELKYYWDGINEKLTEQTLAEITKES